MFRPFTRASKPTSTTVTITDTAPCQKALRVQASPEFIAPVRLAVLTEVQRQATLPGFRKGRAPADLVERQYAQAIREETLQRLTRQLLEEATKDYHLKPVGPFEVTRTDLDEAAGLTLEATVEVEPSFTLGAYKGIPLTKLPVDVTAEELDKALAQLADSMAQLVPTGEGEAKERRVPPLDDELAKDAGFEGLDALKAHVDAKLREQKRLAQEAALESALCDELLRRHDVHVPPKLVGRQTERLRRDFTVRLLLSGMPQARVEEETAKFSEQLRTSAQRYVRLAFVLERIAEQESVTVSQDEIVGRLWQLAQRWKKDPAEVRKLLDAQGLWPSVVSTIRQEKTMAVLLAAAAMKNGTATQRGGTHDP